MALHSVCVVHWTKILGVERVATKALSEFLGRVEGAARLYAGVAKHDVTSIRVLEKCGFAIVGKEESEYTMKLAAN